MNVCLENDFPTLIEIKKTIPSHCFRSNLGTSLFFVFRALFLAVGLGCLFYISRIFACNMLVNLLYAALQGTVFWGMFTIGHDCGHGAFSHNYIINWMVGNLIHGVILTPYEPWRLSHRSHHKNTGNIDKEEIFYPNPPLFHRFLITTLGGSWFAYILVSNVSGRRNYLAYFSHEFADKSLSLLTSFLTISGVIYFLLKIANSVGWMAVSLYYGAPLFVFASWLVVVTFLHHNDEFTPWYTNVNCLVQLIFSNFFA